jgi:hypothetical protein
MVGSAKKVVKVTGYYDHLSEYLFIRVSSLVRKHEHEKYMKMLNAFQRTLH